MVTRNQVFALGRQMQQADFSGAFSQVLDKFTSGWPLLQDLVVNTASRILIEQAGAITHSDVIGQPVDEALKNLKQAQVVVGNVEPFYPDKGMQNLIRFITAPPRLEKGVRVNLIKKDEKVLFYTGTTALAGALDIQVEVDNLRNELLQLQQLHQQELAARDKEIADLKAGVSDSLRMFNELRNRVDRLSPPRPE